MTLSISEGQISTVKFSIFVLSLGSSVSYRLNFARKSSFGTINLMRRFLGAAIIIVGFYSVLWAKSKEAKIGKGNEMIESLESTTQHVPLLRNRSEEQRSVSR